MPLVVNAGALQNVVCRAPPGGIYRQKSLYERFMQYVAEGKEGELRPVATVQTYVLAKYNEGVDRMVKEEFAAWQALMRLTMKSQAESSE